MWFFPESHENKNQKYIVDLNRIVLKFEADRLRECIVRFVCSVHSTLSLCDSIQLFWFFLFSLTISPMFRVLSRKCCNLFGCGMSTISVGYQITFHLLTFTPIWFGSEPGARHTHLCNSNLLRRTFWTVEEKSYIRQRQTYSTDNSAEHVNTGEKPLER